MSHTVATFDRINALVDRTSKEIRNVLIQMPGDIISSMSTESVCPPPPVQRNVPRTPQKALPQPVNYADEIRVSPTHTALSAASSGSQISSLIQKHKGTMGSARIYRSLDRKHLLLVNTVDLEEPFTDGEARKMEKSLKTHSETSTKDYSQRKKKGHQHKY